MTVQNNRITFQTKRLLAAFKPCICNEKFVFDFPCQNRKIDILNLEFSNSKYSEYMIFQFYSKEDTTHICHVMLINKRNKLEVSFGTDEKFRRQGYMTEALTAAIKWIFNNTIEDSIWAIPSNKISQTVLEKCGFKYHSPVQNCPSSHWYIIERVSVH